MGCHDRAGKLATVFSVQEELIRTIESELFSTPRILVPTWGQLPIILIFFSLFEMLGVESRAASMQGMSQ